MKASASIKKLKRLSGHDQHEEPEILADTVVSITAFQRNPSVAVKAGKGATVAVLNHGVPEFYCVPAQRYAELLDVLDDAALQKLVQLRKNEKLVEVDFSSDLQPVRLQK